MKNKTNKKIKIISAIFLLAGALVISGCGCKQTNTKKYSLSLEIWGTLDRNDALAEIFDNYKKINPNISAIVYKKISQDTYAKEVLDALASGQGPDIFMINNAWLPAFQDKIVPAPTSQGMVDEQKFRNNFVDTVANDFLVNGKIYAVPLSVDSLGLYYNKDLFNEAGISAPPTDWNQFIDDVRKLTKIDASGNIIQAGAAIGTAYNINRSTDILNMLMLQSGTKMIGDSGRIIFDESVSANGKSFSPGENALNFYTQFANSASPNYTWNSNLHYSLDAFSEGTAAMMFNYSWNVATVKSKAPKLNFSVASVPQFENSPRVNVSNYWAFAVAGNKIPKSDPYGGAGSVAPVSNDVRIGEAWIFLTYLATKPDGTFVALTSGSGVGQTINSNFDPAASYLEKTGEPAARRDLIEKQKSDSWIGIFAADNLIAKNWRQPDSVSTEAIFAEMIDKVNRGQSSVADALRSAAVRVQGLTQQ